MYKHIHLHEARFKKQTQNLKWTLSLKLVFFFCFFAFKYNEHKLLDKMRMDFGFTALRHNN